MTLVLLATIAAIAAWICVARRVLLAWYLREVRGLAIAEAPEDAIVTYPLA
jgi:hypothetical protein